MRSLRNRLAFFFFAITFVAFGALYLYVAPGLRSRLENEKLKALAAAARRYSGPIVRTVGGAVDAGTVRARVDDASQLSGYRVTLLLVIDTQSGAQYSLQADSGNPVTQPLRFPVFQHIFQRLVIVSSHHVSRVDLCACGDAAGSGA